MAPTPRDARESASWLWCWPYSSFDFDFDFDSSFSLSFSLSVSVSPSPSLSFRAARACVTQVERAESSFASSFGLTLCDAPFRSAALFVDEWPDERHSRSCAAVLAVPF